MYEDLNMQPDGRQQLMDSESKINLLETYRVAMARLFLLDYDGTLTPRFNLPFLAAPDNLLLDILNKLARDEKNAVYILSGRDSVTMEKWLGHLPLNLVARQDARVRYAGEEWRDGVTGPDVITREILSRHRPDFTLAVGDDEYDEEIFRLLADRERTWTLKVGPGVSAARYYMRTPQMVLSLLRDFS